MSIWELAIAAQGYRKANSNDDEIEPLTVEQYDADIAKAAARTVH